MSEEVKNPVKEESKRNTADDALLEILVLLLVSAGAIVLCLFLLFVSPPAGFSSMTFFAFLLAYKGFGDSK